MSSDLKQLLREFKERTGRWELEKPYPGEAVEVQSAADLEGGDEKVKEERHWEAEQLHVMPADFKQVPKIKEGEAKPDPNPFQSSSETKPEVRAFRKRNLLLLLFLIIILLILFDF